MRSNGLRRLVVVDGKGRPVGIVAAGDLESSGARTASRMRRLLSFGR
jgi:CBS domain-containing protein